MVAKAGFEIQHMVLLKFPPGLIIFLERCSCLVYVRCIVFWIVSIIERSVHTCIHRTHISIECGPESKIFEETYFSENTSHSSELNVLLFVPLVFEFDQR